jgi:1-deoxy-D-xylulose-5-phosphate synthase
MVVMAPKDEQELRDMLFTAVEYRKGPVALRYPRANALGVPVRRDFAAMKIGKGEVERKGKDVAILAIGTMVSSSLAAAELLSREGIEAEVVNMRFVKPLDDELVRSIAARFDALVTVEDNTVQGGFGSAVLESLTKQRCTGISVRIHGLPDDFVDHGTPQELHAVTQLDGPGIAAVTKSFLSSRKGSSTLELVTS